MLLRPIHLLRLIGSFGLALLCTTVSADPPARVGRLSEVQGIVTLRQSGVDDTQQALVNWPITSGHTLHTERGAFAELSLGAATFRLANDTDLTIVQLDDRRIRLQLHGGSVQVRVQTAQLAREIELDTAQGHLLFSEPANVRIDSYDRQRVTAIGVASGSAGFDGGNTRFAVSAGQRADVDGAGLLSVAMRNANRDDDFDRWNMARDRQVQQLAQRGTSRYLSSEFAGYEVLDSYGNWRTTVEYGPLWSPTVLPVGWAPYRDGRWTWIAPWGWTWVDHAPWGYAPSHYGRWVFYEQRWSWTPGVVTTRPVWAPALIGWVGGSGWQVTGSSGPTIAWFPLAPRELYVPVYQATPGYVQQINNTIGINGGALTRLHRPSDDRVALYQNQGVGNAVTGVPSYQFGAGKTVTVQSAGVRGDRLQPQQPLQDGRGIATNSVSTVPTMTIPPQNQMPSNTVFQSPRAQPTTDTTIRSNRGSTVVTVAPGLAVQQANRTVETPPSPSRTGAALAMPPVGSPTQPRQAVSGSRSRIVNPNDAAPRDGFGRNAMQR